MRSREPGRAQFLAHEFAGSQKQVHAMFVRAQPLVQVGFGGKNRRRSNAGRRNTRLWRRGGKAPWMHSSQGCPVGDQIVGWAQ